GRGPSTCSPTPTPPRPSRRPATWCVLRRSATARSGCGASSRSRRAPAVPLPSATTSSFLTEPERGELVTLDISGQVAVVTGGASGLGEFTARRLHAGGCRLAIADIDGGGAVTLAQDLDGTGATARGYAVDVRDRAALERLLASVLADLGGMHILVNNAART